MTHPDYTPDYASECPLCGAKIDAVHYKLPNHLWRDCPENGEQVSAPTRPGQ